MLLDRSAARHTLTLSTQADRDRLTLLEAAHASGALLVVVDDPEDHRIVHAEPARSIEGGSGEGGPRSSRRAMGGAAVSTITREHADELFRAMQQETCRLPLKTPPEQASCIPFLYPDNYCWAVAHRLCQFLDSRQVRAGKIWLFGDLRVPSRPRRRPRAGARQVADAVPRARRAAAVLAVSGVSARIALRPGTSLHVSVSHRRILRSTCRCGMGGTKSIAIGRTLSPGNLERARRSMMGGCAGKIDA